MNVLRASVDVLTPVTTLLDHIHVVATLAITSAVIIIPVMVIDYANTS